MFYSQFILAKKGPLGTIWIAAHLERKLRKNQVADTDIGVSVDSILFPEVPIALRLSSHLLLGVVRIYSRKVNYLFHDCSEALLKIKQAFRSTAVDLPPEESTAPYHSITLPETFDLDDFELPDFGFSHGNYVDHHVSTREQITLQDTMDDMVFSTSQFGLDERFGDEGASQLGLDFDEGFLLDTVHSPAHTSALLSSDDNVLEQVNDQTKASIGSMEFDEQPYDVNATRNSGCAEHTEEFPSLGCSKQVDFSSLNSEGNGSVDLVGIEIRTPELIKESLLHMVDQEQLLDPQGAPSTPGLTEKAITRNVDELPSLCNLRKDSYSPDSFLDEPDNSKLAAGESDEGIKNIIAGKSIETVMPVAVLDGSSNDVNSNDVMDIDHGSHDIQMMPPNDDVACEQHDHGMLHDMTVISKSSDPKVAKVSEVTCQEILADSTAVNNVECKDCSAPDHLTAEASAEADNSTCSSNCVLHACNKIPETVNNMNLQDESSKEQASCCSNEVAGTEHDTLGNEKQLHGMTVDGSTQQLVSSQPSEKVILSNTDERCLNISQPDVGHIQESDYPDLETLCSAPPEASDLPEDLVAKDSSSHDASLLSDKRAMTVSGKKRTSMDSSPVLPDGNPSKTSKFSQTSRSVNFIPNDDDLLASILVGRRTPIFKIKSTPTDEALPSRRPRASNKGSAQKRKVLLDDTMVLHGDIIRQQLTSIEDIRKLRRKAPCTTLEIWRIQKLASADEIFIEPLFSGVCPAITCLYSKTLSLTGDGNFSLISKDVEPVGSSDVVKELNSKNVVELLRNSPRSNCLQVQESAEKLESKMSLLHSLESMKDADETLVHEPRVCIASEAPLEDDRNGYSVTNDISSDHPVENDTLLISPLTEHVQNNGSTDFVITVDGTGGINPSHSDMGSTLGKDAPNEASFPLMEATENKHVDIVKEVTEEHYALGEKSDKLVIGGVDGMPSSSVKLDFQPQWLDNGEISCPVLPDATQFGHSLSRGNESLNSEMYDGSSHERNMPVNKVHDECASGDDKVMTEMVSRDSKISTMLVDIDNAVSCPALLQYEAQHFPMCIEGASDHGNQIAVEGDSGKALNQFEELGCGDEGNGIEFLNADDEPELEEDGGMNTSTVEHEKIEDNSGWSIRTRGVAKYLKSLFESIESDSNKLEIATQKSVPLDRLLAGKTRKEASRMFFETLVLNTRDYINVKQELPFDSVGVGPKPKLMKSDF